MRLDLDGLADASREALMVEWREVVGRPPPKHMSRPLMVQLQYAQLMQCTYSEYVCVIMLFMYKARPMPY